MDITLEEISGLIERPSEGLNREIKTWIDPKSPHGIEKIVKSCFALRNRNGGFLLIGFDNTLQPDVGNAPADVRTQFHLDVIQAIISKYASQPFEIAVGFGSREGIEFPVIKIDEGVRAPVAVKRALNNGSGGILLHDGDVYFRTLASNGTPSSAKALPKDWPDIMEICFENREADIGRFFRRHLPGKELSKLIEAFSGLTGIAVPPPPTLRDRAAELLANGGQRFEVACAPTEMTADERAALQLGMWQVAAVLDPPDPARMVDQNFLNIALGANPQYTGWPVWLDSRGFSDKKAVPRVAEKCWEALIISFETDWWRHLDFMRLDPKGEFFLQRVMQDDLSRKIEPKKALDPVLVILRVGEAIAVAIAMAKALGWKDDARIGMAFQWSRLNGRQLFCWANPEIGVLGTHFSHTDDVKTFTELPTNTPISAIAPYVAEATRELFVVFNGTTIPEHVVEHWTQKLIERRLGSA
ncbi:MAG: ATP-binding protein [Puia sp.]|nr:ATP-binding protein [Puia sp.]